MEVRPVLGQYAFKGLIVTAFFLSCCAGLLTADSISRERREGTLGLLFLTRVKAFDVLLGNFGAAGITCVCALIACLPVLILPLLTGGVTGGEACRKVLVLFDVLFLSLTAGLWASARGRGWFKSARSAVLLLVCFIVLPSWIGPLAGGVFGDVGLLSPMGALHYADDAWYRADSARYWISIAAVHGISWLLLLSAGIRLRRAMREEDGTEESSTTANPENAVVPQRPFKPIEDGMDPIGWRLRRQRGILPVIWAAALTLLIYQYGPNYIFRWFRLGFLTYSTFWGMHLAISVVQASLFGWAASWFFIEARRTGELELLLTTPQGAERIISSQWNWLKCLLFWPVVVLMIPSLTAMVSFFTVSSANVRGWGPTYRPFFACFQVLNCFHIILWTGALIWCGLWFGLKARSQASAIVRIVTVGAFVPYLIGLLRWLYVPFRMTSSYPSSRIGINDIYMWTGLLPQIATLLFFLWLIRWARRRLQTELAHDGPTPLSLSQSIFHALSAVALLVRKARRWPRGS